MQNQKRFAFTSLANNKSNSRKEKLEGGLYHGELQSDVFSLFTGRWAYILRGGGGGGGGGL